jgi:hypothetical protein
LIFRLRAYHFNFRAMESVYFPPGKAGNVVRGALGTTLRFDDTMALASRRPIGGTETLRRVDVSGTAGLPSGFADPPRPFVFRAAHLDGKRFEPGETFSLDVNIFDLRRPLPDIFVRAFSEWERTGLGPRRGRVELLGPMAEEGGTDVSVELTSGPEVSRCSVLFRTPTELKGNPSGNSRNLSKDVPFGVLFARVRDRIGTLRSLYGEGPLPIDFQSLSNRAGLVRTINCDLQYRDVWRRSSRTGAVHGIGGVTGSVSYEGDLTEFLPYLRAAWWSGVGRHTVWGNGVIEVVHAE